MTEPCVHKVPSVLYVFPHPLERTLRDIVAGRAPSERAYGLVELHARGWQVGYSDSRHHRMLGTLYAKLNRFVRLVDVATLRAVGRHDIILVKDEFSLLLTTLARIIGRKVVYLDAMFTYPTRFWRRWSCWLNVRLASRVLCYSHTQARYWAQRLGVPVTKFEVVPYGIDVPFYVPGPGERRRPYILAVGRDPGRDFSTLIDALEGSGLRLKLVTLPYLLPKGVDELPWVEIHERVSYEELFRLYAGAISAVVPLKAGLTYPSGLRAVYESILLGRPVTATRTPVLEEFFLHGSGVWFVPAEDPAALYDAVERIQRDPQAYDRVTHAARDALRVQCAMSLFVDRLEAILRPLVTERVNQEPTHK